MDPTSTISARANTAIALAVLAALTAAVALGLALRKAPIEELSPYTPGAAERAPDHFLARFRPGAAADAVRSLNAANGVEQLDRIAALDIRVLTVPPGKTVEDMVAIYSRNPNVEFAEADLVMSVALTPNDPFYTYDVTPFGRISAPAGWDVSTGSSAVKLAVIDTGIDFTHPEFAGRTVGGYDFVNLDADPTDDHGHGTLAAGVAAATGNNSIGVAGVNWKTTIMPVKVLDSSGSGFASTIAKGITYAADNGARVLSMSLGGGASSTMLSAVQYAAAKDCVLVAASGNDGLLIDRYPAAYPDVISVGALQGDTIATFSNYGPNVDITAPGVSIYTSSKGGGYAYFSGTSAATPFVAGLAALAIGVAPGRSAALVSRDITSTATDLGSSGWDQYYGWGRIDIAKALAAAGGGQAPAPTEPTPTPAPTPAPAPDTTAPTVSITAPASGSTVSGTYTITALASDGVGVIRVDFYVDSTLLGSDTGAPYSLAWNTAKVANGSHVVTVRAFDGAGNASTAQVTVNVSNSRVRKK